MTVVKWDPFLNVSALQERINRLFNESFPQSQQDDDALMRGAWKPAVDIYDTDSAIILDAELPGLTKEGVSIEIRENVLTIKGERTADKPVSSENYYRRERQFGAFHRAFSLPESVDPDQVRASFKNGILHIEVPKPEEKKRRQVEIKSEN